MGSGEAGAASWTRTYRPTTPPRRGLYQTLAGHGCTIFNGDAEYVGPFANCGLSSWHPGVVVASMADGRVVAISEDVDHVPTGWMVRPIDAGFLPPRVGHDWDEISVLERLSSCAGGDVVGDF